MEEKRMPENTEQMISLSMHRSSQCKFLKKKDLQIKYKVRQVSDKNK